MLIRLIKVELRFNPCTTMLKPVLLISVLSLPSGASESSIETKK
jgi:hypothetical protein